MFEWVYGMVFSTLEVQDSTEWLALGHSVWGLWSQRKETLGSVDVEASPDFPEAEQL